MPSCGEQGVQMQPPQGEGTACQLHSAPLPALHSADALWDEYPGQQRSWAKQKQAALRQITPGQLSLMQEPQGSSGTGKSNQSSSSI